MNKTFMDCNFVNNSQNWFCLLSEKCLLLEANLGRCLCQENKEEVASRNSQLLSPSLRKHAYSNTLNISPSKTESLQINTLIFFHISGQNIDCGYSIEPPRQGGSIEYTQSMFLAEIKQIMYTPLKPQFYNLKVGFKGFKIIQVCFRGVRE